MSTNEPGTETNADANPPPQQGTLGKIINHITGNKIEAALWATRLFTVVSVFNFFIPIWSYPASAFQKALLSNAATSALRLHQRLPRVEFNREFFGRLFLEDSAHYLFYSIIFLTSSPVTMVLIPIFLFALLHAQNYTKQLLNIVGPNFLGIIRNLLGKLESQQTNILRFIAINEIFLMPATLVMIFTGYGTLLLPFIYYRFLSLRYGSQRNPYCRQVFSELRMSIEQFANGPSCPQALKNLIFKSIAFVNRLAPQTMQQQQ